MPHFKAEQLYIKLDKKLTFHAKQIDVSISSNNTNKEALQQTHQIYSLINFARNSFSTFSIETLRINENEVTISYKEDAQSLQDNSLHLKNKEIDALVYFHEYDDFFILDLPRLQYLKNNVMVHAKGIVDFKNEESSVIVSLSLPDCATAKLYLKENGDALAFTASSDEFTDLAPIIDLLKLKEHTVKWIVDKNQAESYQLLQAQGVYAYNNPDTIINTLFLHGHETNLEYSFNPTLSTLNAKTADAYFSKGILTIEPDTINYKEHIIDEGHVSLDFNDKHIMLSIDLNAQTALDQDIVNIVNAYRIPLPLLQENGTTQAHLTIDIDLWTEDASASGQFFIKSSDLTLDGNKYHIKNAAIRLHKSFLSLDTVDIDYEDIFSAQATGQMDLASLSGNFFFDVKKTDIALSEEKHIQLLSPDTRIQMQFAKESQSYIFPKTLWAIDEQNISVEANKLFLPVKFASKTYVHDLQLHLPNLTDANVSGSFDSRHDLADLNITLGGLAYKDKGFEFSSQNKNLPLKLKHENNTTRLILLSDANFSLNANQLHIKPTEVVFKANQLDLNTTDIALNDDFSTKVSAHYQLGSKQAIFQLQNTRLISEKYLFIEPPFELAYEERFGKHYFDINSYGVHAVLHPDKEIDLNLKNLSKLYPYSPIMHTYDVKAGQADLTFIDKRIGMDITIKDFHPFLSSKEGKAVTQYNIKGDYQNDTATLRINHQLDLVYREKGKLKASNLEFNLFPIRDYLKFIQTNDSNSSLDLSIKTNNCSISLGDSRRKIISDSISVSVRPPDIHAELIYKKGGILFESHDNNFSVFGRELDDTFMNQLFKFSTFQGGSLSFMMQGTFDEFKGVTKIDNTTIRDYTVLNNALAFFNTIPSLVTFTVPGYSKKGLKVSEMYSSLHFKGNKAYIRDTKVTSKELTITAEGETDFEKEQIDLLMQVKTDIGSTAKNIPLIGYIIFGDDSVSTTVRVHGSTKDPKVENAVAKSIIAAPFNIIKRTITLPFKVFDIFDKDEKKNED